MGLMHQKTSVYNLNYAPINQSEGTIKNKISWGLVLRRTRNEGSSLEDSVEIVLSTGEGGFSTVCVPLFGDNKDKFKEALADFIKQRDSDRQAIVKTRTYYFRRYSREQEDFLDYTEKEINSNQFPQTYKQALQAVKRVLEIF